MTFTTGGPPRATVTVSRAADPPDLPGPPTVRFVAPGARGARFPQRRRRPVSFLILFAPGIARERFFTELAQMRRQGVELTPEGAWRSTPATIR